MTSLKNAIIINHKIKFAPAGAPAGASLVSLNSLDKWAEYASREGRFAALGGLDARITEADKTLEAQKRAFSRDITGALLYGSRRGAFAKKGEDNPLVAGEKSGEVWDERGICDWKDVRREIVDSGSNVIQSVFTVSREWAESLNMCSKEDFQNIMRSHWNDLLRECGIPEGNQRWVAEFHVDGTESLHCHILSWDSGEHGLQFTGDKRIPRATIHTSKENIRAAIMRDIALERSIVKDWARDALLLRTKEVLGMKVSAKERNNVREKTDVIGESVFSGRFEGDGVALNGLLERTAWALPESGRLAYTKIGDEARAGANLCVSELLKDPESARIYERWKNALETGADILGYEGIERERYMDREISDMKNRLAIQVIKTASAKKEPWLFDDDLAKEQSLLIRKLADSAPKEMLLSLASHAGVSGDCARRETEKLSAQLTAESSEFIDAYKEHVISHVRELRRKTDDDLDKRIAREIDERIERVLPMKILCKVASENSREEQAYERKALRDQIKGTSVFLTERMEQEMTTCIITLAASRKRGEPDEKLRKIAQPTIMHLMVTPEFAASFKRCLALNAELIGKDGEQRERKAHENAIFNELLRAAENMNRREEVFRRDLVLSCVGSALAAGKAASSLESSQDGAIRIKKRKRSNALLIER